jgi:hypothetical protein
MFGKGRTAADVNPRTVRMNGKAFAKLIRESGVLGRGLDATRVDLCFARSCDKVCHFKSKPNRRVQDVMRGQRWHQPESIVA